MEYLLALLDNDFVIESYLSVGVCDLHIVNGDAALLNKTSALAL